MGGVRKPMVTQITGTHLEVQAWSDHIDGQLLRLFSGFPLLFISDCILIIPRPGTDYHAGDDDSYYTGDTFAPRLYAESYSLLQSLSPGSEYVTPCWGPTFRCQGVIDSIRPIGEYLR